MVANANTARIVVLGGGPAGAAVAIGLVRLGYAVCVVTDPRPFAAIEGISERVLDGLRGAGFKAALSAVAEPTPRSVTWNQQTSRANGERLVDRRQFDQLLLRDLARQGVEVVQGAVKKVVTLERGYRVWVDESGVTGPVDGVFLVEARGRRAPGGQGERLRGAETVSLLHYWHGTPVSPRSGVESFSDGWAWMAADARGTRYIQLTLDVRGVELPKKQQLPQFCEQRLAHLQQAQPFLQGARPSAEVHARASTPVLCAEAVGGNWIRVGDAAMAVDPLSGNGIFQALSSALQAPAVINTLIARPEREALARTFYQQRVNQLFYRFARTGRDFYAMERQWPQRPFWQLRSRWPDLEPIHQAPDPTSLKVETRPVVAHGFIREAEVVVSRDQPLGIWHLDNIELAPVIRALEQLAPGQGVAAHLGQRLGLGATEVSQLCHWLRSQGVAVDETV